MKIPGLSYSRRLWWWLVGYSLLLVAAAAMFQYYREKHFKEEFLNERLQLVNSRILASMTRADSIPPVWEEWRLPFGDLRVSVIDPAGNVVFDNSRDGVPSGSHLDRKEIADALKSGTGYDVHRHSTFTDSTYFYSAMRGKNGYVVRAAVPYTPPVTDFLRADFGFLWFMLLLTAAMCWLGFFATRRLGQNIRRLNQFAASAERGEEIVPAQAFPDDELGATARHIVSIYAAQQQASRDRDREHEEAMKARLDKERIKKQLTNNINHELKTPVASIRICLETLLAHPDMDPKRRGEFLERCMSHADRLSRLLNDVSTLTRIEEGNQAILFEHTDLCAVAEEVVEELHPSAVTKGIVIRTTLSPEGYMQGNAALLSAIFRNLIANAIAYSSGTLVEVEVRRLATGQLECVVADNGVGVGEEHLPRLFERFYRVDKGRSRSLGGTGLGLAIVRNAVVLHGGTITVRNRPGGGLEFRIIWPEKP